ncbi:MAG: hypothetical protein JNM36_08055 [Chitinophagales bacterium]|nr:hypothetical protein [Chitinophagales bacterium]
MENLRNSKWLFLVNTLPIILLFILGSNQFFLIKTLLTPEGVQLWYYFAISLIGIGLLIFLYALYLTKQNKIVSVWYSPIAFLIHILFIFLHLSYSDKMLPSSIPQWLILDTGFLYVSTFLMSTLAYSVLVIVVYLTPSNKDHSIGFNFFSALSVPIIGYVFTQTAQALVHILANDFLTYTMFIVIITLVLVFLFFITRSMTMLFIMFMNNKNKV